MDPLHEKRLIVQSAEEARSLAREKLLSDVRAVMRTEAGRNVLWHCMELGRIFADPFTGNSETFFRLGEQKVSREIYLLVKTADIDALHALENTRLAEARQQREKEDARPKQH